MARKLQIESLQPSSVMPNTMSEAKLIEKAKRAGMSVLGQKLMLRGLRQGAPLDLVALDRKFNFTISPIVTEGADPSVLIRLGKLVTKLAVKEGFQCELKVIVVTPIITDKRVYSRNDFVRYSRASKGYFVGKNIEFASWKNAKNVGKVKLGVTNLESSLLAIPSKHLCSESKTRLIAILHIASVVSLK